MPSQQCRRKRMYFSCCGDRKQIKSIRNKLNTLASPCRRVSIAHFAFTAACCTCAHWHAPARCGVKMHLHCNAASCLLLMAMHRSQLAFVKLRSTCCQTRFRYLEYYVCRQHSLQKRRIFCPCQHKACLAWQFWPFLLSDHLFWQL